MNQTPEGKNFGQKNRKIETKTHIKTNFIKENNDKADCLTVTISTHSSWNKRLLCNSYSHLGSSYECPLALRQYPLDLTGGNENEYNG